MEQLLFDTHCHLDDSQFDTDREQLIRDMPSRGIKELLWVGTDLKTSSMAAQYAERYPYIWFGAGFYPHETDKLTDKAFSELEKLLKHEKCLALGEIGLDYHYDGTPKELQKKALRLQLELAAGLDKPVSLHERDAWEDMLEILSDFAGRVRGVMHCFSGSSETAAQLIKLGLYISFSGVLTFKNGRRAVQAAQSLPREKVLIETDSPYMSPEPLRGTRNQPPNVFYVAQKLGEIWNISTEQAAHITCLNAHRLFMNRPE